MQFSHLVYLFFIVTTNGETTIPVISYGTVPLPNIREAIFIFHCTRQMLLSGVLLGSFLISVTQGCTEPQGEQLRNVFAPVIRQAELVVSAPGDTPGPTATPTPAPTPTPTPTPTPAPTPFSLLWFSDTQVYAYKYPKVFNSMAAFAVNHREELNALCVVHTGDIVDNRRLERHWKNAAHAIGLMKDKIPFYCVAGNHDVGADKPDYGYYFDYDLNELREEENLYEGGVCWYMPFEAGGTKFLLMGLGWQKTMDWLTWAQEVLEDHQEEVVILLVHNFLDDDGSLTSNGRKVERNIVRLYKNVRLVLCGHNDGSARKDLCYDDGRRVYALMYNFQDDKKKGLGYLRILTFDPVSRNIDVTTYSPYLNDYNYYEDESRDSFVLEEGF